MPKTFNVEVDEAIIKIFSLGLLSFLALLWIFIVAVILRLRKIRHRIDKATEVLASRTRNAWLLTNNAFAYSAESLNEDGKDLGQASFECLEAKTGRELVMSGSNTETVFSLSEHSEPNAEEGQIKIYTSLKDSNSVRYKYEKPCNTEKTSQCLADTQGFVNTNYETVSPTQRTSDQTDITDGNDFVVLIGDNKEQSTHRQLQSQQNGAASTILAKKKVDGFMEIDDPQNDYENEYLAIIHSEEKLPEVPENVIPSQEDEYLMPIETVATEKRQEKYKDIHSELKLKIRVPQPVDFTTTIGEGGYLTKKATENSEKSAGNDRQPRLVFQKTEKYPEAQCSGVEAPKGLKEDDTGYINMDQSSKEDDTGYINMDQSSKDSGSQSLACGMGERGDDLKPDETGEEYSYDYITFKQGKEQTVSSGVASKPQEQNLSPGQTTKPQEHIPTGPALYINKDTNVHAKDESTKPSSEYSKECPAIIQNEEFKTREKIAGGKAYSATQEHPLNASDQIYDRVNEDSHVYLEVPTGVKQQNETKITSTAEDTGARYSGDPPPIYENSGFGNANDTPIYANEEILKK